MEKSVQSATITVDLFWLGGWRIVGVIVETIAVSILALLGIILGAFLSKTRRPYCWSGFGVSFLLIGVLAAARFAPRISFTAPLSWIMIGRVRLVVTAVAVTIGLTTSIIHLRYAVQKCSVGILMVIIVGWFCISPFLAPAFVENDLAALKSNIDYQGICYQSRDYTCGPAAAVTALTRLGLHAEEGEIAVRAHSNPIIGTLPGCLSDAIRELYENEGLSCQYRYFDSLSQLERYPPVLVVIKDTFFTDHCVAVMGINDEAVTIADPVGGKRQMNRDTFERVWRCSGIVLERRSAL